MWRHVHTSLTSDMEPSATWIWLGDIVYADYQPYGKWMPFIWRPNSVERVEEIYAQQKQQAGYAALVASEQVDIIGVTDDHDVSANNGDATMRDVMDSMKPALMRFLDEHDELRAGSGRASHDGVYTSHSIGDGRVKVLLLDTRTFRTPLPPAWRRLLALDDGNGDDMLGDAQWQWLRAELQSSEARVHLIGSGTQVLPTDKPIEESWIHHPRSRRRLLDLLAELGTPGVIFISGDIHSAELLRSDCALGYPLYEFTSSGMTHSVRTMLKSLWLSTFAFSVVRSRLTVTDYDHLNYGIIDIDWRDASSAATVRFEIRSHRGELVFEHSAELADLHPSSSTLPTLRDASACADLTLRRERLYLAWLPIVGATLGVLLVFALLVKLCSRPMTPLDLHTVVLSSVVRNLTEKRD
jgi:alkaline phosphatase D